MLYLPEKVLSSYESKLVYIPNYYEVIKEDKNITDEELSEKLKDIMVDYVKLGYECQNYYSIKDRIQEAMIPSKTNNISLYGSLDYVAKKIHLSFSDRKRCYCMNCKKIIRADIEEYTINRSDDYYHYNKVYICPHCKTSSDSTWLRDVNVSYTVFNNVFLDGNKLKIKRKLLTFKEYNKHIFIKKELDVIVMNLDTGMTYGLPTLVNDKPKKGMAIKNISYNNGYAPNLNYQKYNQNCRDIENVLMEAFNVIREYKINNNNFYIPTLDEQVSFALNNGTSKHDIYNIRRKRPASIYSFGSNTEDVEFTDIKLSLGHLMKLNRFPALNIFMNDDFFNFFLRYNLNKNKIKSYKRIRGRIKQNSTNPIKEFATAVNIPYTKALKKYYDKDFNLMFMYKDLENLNIKRDNILKLFSIAYNNNDSRPSCIDSVTSFIENLNILKTFPTYNENNFINKIVNYSAKEKGNSHYISDAFYAIKNIRSYEGYENYEVDLRMDLKTLHDTVVSDQRKIKTKNKVFSYEEKQLEVNGTFNGLHFALAKDSYELIDVGAIMHICVGGYGQRAYDHSCYIVVARNDDNEPIVCIEVDEHFMKLNQTKLKYNAHPKEDSQEYEAILQWCSHANMIPDNYEINSYNRTKEFILGNKELVAKYNKVADAFDKINLERYVITNDFLVEAEEDVVVEEVRYAAY